MMSFDDIAERTRQAQGLMLEELAEELAAVGAGRTESVTGMSAGNVAQAVLFHFNTHAMLGLPMDVARAELDKQVDDFWTQRVAQHVAAVRAAAN